MPEEMLSALVKDMLGAPEASAVEAWKSTLQEKISREFWTMPIIMAELPANRARFPKLQRSEVVGLSALFR